MLQGKNGDLYGVTAEGGSYGFGVLFELAPSGEETIFHNFTGHNRLGGMSQPSLVQDAAAKFYGTGRIVDHREDVLFKVDPTTNSETVLRTSGADGAASRDVRFEDLPQGFGTIFKIKLGKQHGTFSR